MALAMIGFTGSPLPAGTITGVTMFGPNAGPGSGMVDVPAIVTVSPNNDNVGPLVGLGVVAARSRKKLK